MTYHDKKLVLLLEILLFFFLLNRSYDPQGGGPRKKNRNNPLGNPHLYLEIKVPADPIKHCLQNNTQKILCFVQDQFPVKTQNFLCHRTC